MPPEKLRLPPVVRAALRSARNDREKMGQKELAHKVNLKDASVGHYETGERPISRPRLRQLVGALGLPNERATAWWRLAIQERIGELLADGGMPEKDREDVLSVVGRFWPAAVDEQTLVPQRARSVGSSRSSTDRRAAGRDAR